jgi:glycosyltransferase involved in cell wall biosynthesis
VKILILTSVYPPLGFNGHDERCRQTAQGLAAAGHQLQVLTSNHRLPPMGVVGEKGVFRELHLYPNSLSDSSLGQVYDVTYAHDLYNVETLEYRLQRFCPDLVYVWNMKDLSKSLLFYLQNHGVQVIYDLHGDWLTPESFKCDPWYRWWFDNSSLRSRMYRLFIRLTGRARKALRRMPIAEPQKLDLTGSYVVSEVWRQLLSVAGLSQAQALPVVYPATDSRKLLPKRSYQQRRRFAWAGRLDEAKGASLAVAAVGLLKERGFEVSLDLYGKGEPSERKAQRASIEAAGLIDQVTMCGIRPGELTQYYQQYDALLYTTLQPEAFSMTVLEAQLSKLPCIVADISGNSEILRHGDDALFFEPGNVESLVDTMIEFMQREDCGRALAESSIQTLQDDHNIDRFCGQIETLLQTAKTR